MLINIPRYYNCINMLRLPKSASLKRFGLGLLISAPVLLFCLSLILTGEKVAPGDADYLIQTYEAMRRSILEFHQFPWWNPWVSGGVPLFANPQFGLISLQTPFVLIFGSVVGYKIAIVGYFLLGFWGFRQLFIRAFKTPVLTATLLAYIWTFGTFLTQRTSGHLTFLVIQFFPWALLYYLQRHTIKRAWLKFGLITALMALTAAHNTTVMSYFVLALVVLISWGRVVMQKKDDYVTLQLRILRSDLIFWLKAGGLFIILTGYRLFFTVQYLKDFPRAEVLTMESTIGPHKAILALFGPLMQFNNAPTIPHWSWLEASAYISIFTFLAAVIVLDAFLRKRSQAGKLFSYSPYALILLFSFFFLLSLGDFLGVFSPYSMLRLLPIFSDMRVAVRWLAWSSIIVLFFIAAYQGKQHRRVINILLALACVELFIYSRPYLAKAYSIDVSQVRSSSSQFQQKRLYNTQRNGIPYDENLTEATRNNYGQIIAGDALVDTRFPAPWGDPTQRCSVDNGCNLIMTGNASVEYWSPNKIVLKRTAPGDIQIDINPGKGWLINGVYPFRGRKVVDPDSNFVIINDSQTITLEYRPRLSIDWLIEKIL